MAFCGICWEHPIKLWRSAPTLWEVPVSTDKCTDSGSVDRSHWGEIHRRIREAFCGVGGLIPPPLQTRRTPCWEELGKISVSPRASVISIPELFTYALYIVIAFVLEVIYILLSLCCLYCLA